MVVGRGGVLLLVFLLRLVVMWVKGPYLPERHVQVLLSTVSRTRGIQRRGDGKDCAGVGGEVGEPRNLFPRLGVG